MQHESIQIIKRFYLLIAQTGPVSTQKSPIHAQKSPAYTQRSHSETQNRPLHTQKSPTNTQESPIHTQKSHTTIQNSPCHTQKSLKCTQKSQYRWCFDLLGHPVKILKIQLAAACTYKINIGLKFQNFDIYTLVGKNSHKSAR